MQPPLHSLWKQFLSALGQRARQPAYLGAHRELLNCSRTFLGPQRLYRARDPMTASVRDFCKRRVLQARKMNEPSRGL